MFAGTEWWVADLYDQGTDPLEKISFHISRVGDFVVLQEPPHDFGGVAISSPCSGMVLFAGSVIWMGRGRQLHPADPLPPEALQHTSEEVPAPQRIDVWSLGGELEDDRDGLAAWNSVRDLNLVQDLASAPYSVLVYLYLRTVGAFDPDHADWVILVYRGPTRVAYPAPARLPPLAAYPPPAWTPSPPPPWTGDDDRHSLAQTYIRLATDLLNATGGDPDAFLEQVRLWAPTPTPYPALTATLRRVTRTVTPGLSPAVTPIATASPPPTPTPPGPPPTATAPAISPTPTRVPPPTPAPSPTSPFPPSPTASPGPTPTPAPQRQQPASAWAHIADLDDDGAPEWLVSIPLVERQRYSGRDTRVFRCGAGFCPALVVLFEREGRTFTPVHLFTSGPQNWELEYPRVLAVEDLNRNGRAELVLESRPCGLSCLTRLLVGRWDGRHWHDLTADPLLTEMRREQRAALPWRKVAVAAAGVFMLLALIVMVSQPAEGAYCLNIPCETC